jgi:hypothetical protein
VGLSDWRWPANATDESWGYLVNVIAHCMLGTPSSVRSSGQR